MTIILPESVSNHNIFTAAMYMVATNAKSAEDVVKKKAKDERPNVDSAEVKNKIKESTSSEFLHVAALCERSNICEATIDSAHTVFDAIERVAKEIKRYSVMYLNNQLHTIGNQFNKVS